MSAVKKPLVYENGSSQIRIQWWGKSHTVGFWQVFNGEIEEI